MPDHAMSATPSNKPTIASLLARRDTRLLGPGGDVAAAREREELSIFLWENFSAFNRLRKHLLRTRSSKTGHYLKTSLRTRTATDQRLIDLLTGRGMITRFGDDAWLVVNDKEVNTYLFGGWLEELAYLAMLAGGAEEARHSQMIQWTVGAHVGQNEIDIIGRRGDVLSFVSCKTVAPVYDPDDQRLRDKFRGFLLETDYWDLHFADGQGRSVLLVTSDLVDESQGSWRCPTLAARATVLDVDLIGTDGGTWDSLVSLFRRHWEE